MARVDHGKTSPDGMQHLYELHKYSSVTVDKKLLDIVYLRVSQINGCSYCVDLHWADALKGGEDMRKINSVVTWKKTPFFSDKERAALLLAEKLTDLHERELSDEVYDKVKPHFTDKEIVDLVLAIANMNAMNRMAIAFKKMPV